MRRRRAAATAASAIVMPAALNVAIPTLQALHEEQRLLFFAELLMRSHRWHCHEAATAEADLSELGRHSAENQKWGILERFGGVHERKKGREDSTSSK